VSHRRWDTIDAAWTWRELPERSATCVADTILSAPRRQTRVCKRALMHCGNSPLMWRVSSSVQERSFNYIKGNAIFVRDLIELLLDDPFLYTCCELLYSYEFFKCTYPFYCNEWGHLWPHRTYYIAPSYPSVTTSSGAFCGVNATYSTARLCYPKRHLLEEVVTDGYEGATLYVQCGQRWPHSLHYGNNFIDTYSRNTIWQLSVWLLF